MRVQRYNKALAAACVVVIAWAFRLAGVEVPAEVAAAFTTILVYAIPNEV